MALITNDTEEALFKAENFPPLQNDLLLRATKGESVYRIPVWIMRQAGRYLPEFRELRLKHDFFTICQTPELACEVTLQPIRRFDLDAAIIFSDILVIPQALGMTVEMIPGKGPSFPEPLEFPEDVKKLNDKVDVKVALDYVYKAITLTRHKLNGKVPLIGFSGAPWTLMAYMIEGGGSKTWSKAKKWLYQYETASSRLLAKITDVVVNHLVEQARAGAQVLQVFESIADIMSPSLFSLNALPYLRDIATRVKQILGDQAVPMIIFAKGAHFAITDLTHSDFDVIALDWTMKIKDARLTAPAQTLMGNLDPCALYSNEKELKSAVKHQIRQFGTSRYIANLGHGIYPDVDPAKVEIFVNAVHDYSEKLLANDLSP